MLILKKSCHECGLVSEFNNLQAGEKAQCPRCGHTLLSYGTSKAQGPIALSIAGLMTLVMSLTFPFMSFGTQGITQEITLFKAVEMMSSLDNAAIAGFLLASIILLPAFFLVSSIFLYRTVQLSESPLLNWRLKLAKKLLKAMSIVKPWLMVDVFLIGVLVSLIKIASMADISMGQSFWAFCFYTVIVIRAVSLIDLHWLWDAIVPVRGHQNESLQDYQHHGHHACHVCGAVEPLQEVAHCARCGSHLHSFDATKSLNLAWALLITSAIFYIPANLYPMMYTSAFGTSEGSTILEGVVLIWNMGSYPVALIILLASVIIPLAKMFALAYLYWNANRVHDLPIEESKRYLKIYRVTEFIGRWSMIDIFVVAILVALVQLDGLMAIYPGPAALSFGVVVVFTMLSAMVFDSRILWR